MLLSLSHLTVGQVSEVLGLDVQVLVVALALREVGQVRREHLVREERQRCALVL